MRRELVGLAIVVCGVAPCAGTAQPAASGPAKVQQGTAEQPATAPPPLRHSEEITVESASRVETTLVDAPATLSVVTSQELATTPAQNYAELLRSVPGMNVVQTSARDYNLTTRQATSTLNNSQLVLVDGRSVYLDFFGLVLWDFVPSPSSGDVKQIEVVRGPASVVWGANALTGVVNVLTKSPRENEGSSLTLEAGIFGRGGGSREAEGQGYQFGGGLSHAEAVNPTWSYRLAAGYFNSDPYSRPVGRIPLDCHPYGAHPCRGPNGEALKGGFPVGGASYPSETTGAGNFRNSGARQPKLDLRVDQEVGKGRLSYQAGYAGTEGIIHTGIGPFDIQSGSYMAHAKALYTRGALRVGTFANLVDVDAPNLLQTDPATLKPVVLAFQTQTYDLEMGDSRVLAGKHLLSYGGNYRRNEFKITLAPGSPGRNELGAYLQEEFFLSKIRLAAGARADKFGNIDHWVFSPRLSVMFKPAPDHSVRLSYNRAFRSPSVINNYLDQSIFSPTPIDLRPLAAMLSGPLRSLIPDEPFLLIVNTTGSRDLQEEHLDAFELAYTGVLGRRTTLGFALYHNVTDDNINFASLLSDSEHPQGLPGLEYYSASRPAQGVGAVSGRAITLDARVMQLLAQVNRLLPYRVSGYINLGPIRNQGVEASIAHRLADGLRVSANYSWQDDPKILEPGSGQLRYPLGEVGLGPTHRFNLGASYDGRRTLGDLSVSYTGRAFWNDVLDDGFHGFTDGYTLLNGTMGVKLARGKVVAVLKGTNLLDRGALQHIYGDLIRRTVAVEVRLRTR